MERDGHEGPAPGLVLGSLYSESLEAQDSRLGAARQPRGDSTDGTCDRGLSTDRTTLLAKRVAPRPLPGAEVLLARRAASTGTGGRRAVGALGRCARGAGGSGECVGWGLSLF